mmetsp:Transcript_4005/g.16005  ORF Transcript_4005/g.16005 Transcript_4005/m.16005 type:complete len:884 (+) Transcript_4005:169-2820(+)
MGEARSDSRATHSRRRSSGCARVSLSPASHAPCRAPQMSRDPGLPGDTPDEPRPPQSLVGRRCGGGACFQAEALAARLGLEEDAREPHELGDGDGPFDLVVAAVPDGDGALLELVLADDEDVVVLRELRVPDLLGERVARGVAVGVESGRAELGAHGAGVVVVLVDDRDDDALARRDPEGPLAAPVLGEHGDHALDRAEHGAVDDDRPPKEARRERSAIVAVGRRRGAVGRRRAGSLGGLVGATTRAALVVARLVFEPESDRELEVELDRRALVDAVERVGDLDVDLGSVERAVARVDAPAALAGEVVHGSRERGLGFLPERDVAEGLGRPRRELEFVAHAEGVVDVLHEVQRPLDLGLDLVFAAEDVRVVLLEAADAREPREGARQFVAVQDAEVGVAHRKVAPRAQGLGEHEAVARAVHGLEAEFGAFDVEAEHVVFVVERVARGVPEVEVVDVGRDDLVVLAQPVLLADERDEPVVDARAARLEEGRPRRERVEEEERLRRADAPVVALRRLFHAFAPLDEVLLVGERDAVDALQRVVVGLAEPVRRRGARHFERLDAPRVGQVRPHAEVDDGARLVRRRAAAVGNLGRDERDFERVLGEHLEQLGFGHDEPLERRLRVGDLLHGLGEFAELGVRDRRVAHVRVVVEAAVDGGADGELAAVPALEHGAEQVARRVPERRLAFLRLEIAQLERAVALERPLEVPQLARARRRLVGVVVVVVVVDSRRRALLRKRRCTRRRCRAGRARRRGRTRTARRHPLCRTETTTVVVVLHWLVVVARRLRVLPRRSSRSATRQPRRSRPPRVLHAYAARRRARPFQPARGSSACPRVRRSAPRRSGPKASGRRLRRTSACWSRQKSTAARRPTCASRPRSVGRRAPTR